MGPDDAAMRVDYFWSSSDEHLHLMGVDRSRLPERSQWVADARTDASRPVLERTGYGVIWEADGSPVGFSTTDRVVIGSEAFMHLHVTVPELRHRGLGTKFVRLTARHYFEVFDLERLFCEPNALNVAPNRTLQRAGFHYVFSHECTPGPINFPQVTTRWILNRPDLAT